MSSISYYHPNPSPNPKFNSNKPSSSIKLPKPKLKRKTKKTRNKNKNKNKKKPNWLELPQEIWSIIFSKLSTMEIIANVEDACKLFRKICKQASLYKVVDMTIPDGFNKHSPDDVGIYVNVMTEDIVDRSCGGLLDIYLEYFCDDDTLKYIVKRSKNLKHLRLGNYICVSDEGLINAVKRLPKLEEIEIIICHYSAKTIEAIGLACPSLKAFSFNSVGSKSLYESNNAEALAIAKTMPNLRKLQLIGNTLGNEGLKAILDGCLHLESLDLRACYQVDLSGELGKRCSKIKQLRLPNDSTADYSHEACIDSSEENLIRELISPRSSDYDSDDTSFFGTYPDILQDYLGVDDFGDLYFDPLYDAFDCFPPYFFSDSDFSD